MSEEIEKTQEGEAAAPEAPAAETPAPEAATAETPAEESAPVVEETPIDDGGIAADVTPAETPVDEGGAVTGLDIGSQSIPSDEPAAAPVVRGRVDKFGVAMGTGRRKTSVARVRIKDGSGKIEVNGRSVEDFFSVERDQLMVTAPLRATETAKKVDVWVKVKGGGTTGQTGAVLLGIARALQARDESLHGVLAEGGYLTRDDRMVERKKYGLAKARRSFQFSKR